MRTIFVTGGAGFIGAALVRLLIGETDWRIVNIDKLTYAGNLESLQAVAANPRHVFCRTDICARTELDRLFIEHKPAGVIHLAAESHVDRSIHGPAEFIDTNIVGTYTLLEAARVDGADAFKTFRMVVLPLSVPAINPISRQIKLFILASYQIISLE